MHKAFVHSIHSQVSDTVKKLNKDFDLIISMDAHLDNYLGLNSDIYPDELKQIAARSTAHTMLRHTHQGDFIIVIPEGMAKSITLNFIQLARSRGIYVEFSKKYIKSLEQMYDIEIYLSPPNILKRLISKTKRYNSFLLDIDYDYIYEAQKECYTSIHNAVTGELQSMDHVIKFIKKIKPDYITISEAKLSAIQNSNSIFNSFLVKIRKIGYKVEISELAESDEKILKGIKDTEDYYLSWNDHEKKLNLNYDDINIEEERSFAKKFFRERGYFVEK